MSPAANTLLKVGAITLGIFGVISAIGGLFGISGAVSTVLSLAAAVFLGPKLLDMWNGNSQQTAAPPPGYYAGGQRMPGRYRGLSQNVSLEQPIEPPLNTPTGQQPQQWQGPQTPSL